MTKNLRKEITEGIVKSIAQGVVPWRRPWKTDPTHPAVSGTPQNAVSKNVYRGGNRLILLCTMLAQGYSDPRWLTFNQAKALGGSVNKGERGTYIEYWKHTPAWSRPDVEVYYKNKKVTCSGGDKDFAHIDGVGDVDARDVFFEYKSKKIPWSSGCSQLSRIASIPHVVFNVQQCSNLNIEQLQIKNTEINYGDASDIVQGMVSEGVTILHNSTSASYIVLTDTIRMPRPDAFDTPEKYYVTLLHELAHATGHPSRLGRRLSTKFGSDPYAYEELVAELASVFVYVDLGFQDIDNEQHAAYIASWASMLQEGEHIIFKAAKDASTASDYILKYRRKFEPVEEYDFQEEDDQQKILLLGHKH
jgi:putative DNA primase/helicase